MSAQALIESTGFAQPVHESQAIFRAVLCAMAQPGTLQTLSSAVHAPHPLSPASASVLLTLADHDTPVWLQEPDPDAATFLRFYCGCKVVDNAGDALFAVITQPAEIQDFTMFRQGTPEYPDRSATLIVECEKLQMQQTGGTTPLQLAGPGIAQSRTLFLSPFPESLSNALTENHRRFPCGVDVLLTCRQTLAALPRTTRVER